MVYNSVNNANLLLLLVLVLQMSNARSTSEAVNGCSIISRDDIHQNVEVIEFFESFPSASYLKKCVSIQGKAELFMLGKLKNKLDTWFYTENQLFHSKKAINNEPETGSSWSHVPQQLLRSKSVRHNYMCYQEVKNQCGKYSLEDFVDVSNVPVIVFQRIFDFWLEINSEPIRNLENYQVEIPYSLFAIGRDKSRLGDLGLKINKMSYSNIDDRWFPDTYKLFIGNDTEDYLIYLEVDSKSIEINAFHQLVK